MKKVVVLMSTYNGEKFLSEQIDSILNQTNVDVSLIVRDDGSTDHTTSILSSYASKHTNIKIILGENKGYKDSFMELFYNVRASYDYYAFADQDDVWLPDKLSRAVDIMNETSQPTLYHSYMTQVDKNLSVMKEQQKFHDCPPKTTILFQGFSQGSTIVVNNSFYKIAEKYQIKKEVSHDIWLPILAKYVGQIIDDKASYILYRRHQNAVTNELERNYWLNIIKFVLSKKRIDNFAINLLDGYRSMLSDEDIKELDIIVNYRNVKNKIKLLLSKKVCKASIIGTVLLKAAILFNRME